MIESRTLAILIALGMAAALTTGCAGKRVRIITATTVGLNATPGDPEAGESPQVTLAYKRAEAALVPTGERQARHDPDDPSKHSDAYSVLAAFQLSTEWFGSTEVSSFIATGHASRLIVGLDDKTGDQSETAFTQTLSKSTLDVVAPDLQQRRVSLIKDRAGLSDAQVNEVLQILGVPPGTVPQHALQDAIAGATTGEAVAKIEAAYTIVKEQK